jgi:hypothetical protein
MMPQLSLDPLREHVKHQKAVCLLIETQVSVLRDQLDSVLAEMQSQAVLPTTPLPATFAGLSEAKAVVPPPPTTPLPATLAGLSEAKAVVPPPPTTPLPATLAGLSEAKAVVPPPPTTPLPATFAVPAIEAALIVSDQTPALKAFLKHIASVSVEDKAVAPTVAAEDKAVAVDKETQFKRDTKALENMVLGKLQAKPSSGSVHFMNLAMPVAVAAQNVIVPAVVGYAYEAGKRALGSITSKDLVEATSTLAGQAYAKNAAQTNVVYGFGATAATAITEQGYTKLAGKASKKFPVHIYHKAMKLGARNNWFVARAMQGRVGNWMAQNSMLFKIANLAYYSYWGYSMLGNVFDVSSFWAAPGDDTTQESLSQQLNVLNEQIWQVKVSDVNFEGLEVSSTAKNKLVAALETYRALLEARLASLQHSDAAGPAPLAAVAMRSGTVQSLVESMQTAFSGLPVLASYRDVARQHLQNIVDANKLDVLFLDQFADKRSITLTELLKFVTTDLATNALELNPAQVAGGGDTAEYAAAVDESLAALDTLLDTMAAQYLHDTRREYTELIAHGARPDSMLDYNFLKFYADVKGLETILLMAKSTAGS